MTHPLLLELNARCWLQELCEASGRHPTFAAIPQSTLDEWICMGITHLWLMGVWTTGPLSRRRALEHPSLRVAYTQALPDWREGDVAGSPYAIASYTVPEVLGGNAGLLELRRQFHQHGLKLVLDFVPNHVGLDHPWLEEHPEYFVRCSPGHPHAFRRETRRGEYWMAHGRDPNFSSWDDTAQLDYRRADVQQAMLDELMGVAALCDGVRCDMAMLLLKDVFHGTWKDCPPEGQVDDGASAEFWERSIARVKARHPGFMLLAEVYWGMEARLQQLGFDYTYDKQFTDALLHGGPTEAVRHIQGQTEMVIGRCAHFLENHDEDRVASVLTAAEHQAAALAVLALPGLRLIHEGQAEGSSVRTPVQLARRRKHPGDSRIEALYRRLFEVLRSAGVGQGRGSVLRPQPAWSDNSTWESLLVVRWDQGHGPFALVVANLSAHRSQCRVSVAPITSDEGQWELDDLLSDERWLRSSSELRDPGLFLDVGDHAVHAFVCRPHRAGEMA